MNKTQHNAAKYLKMETLYKLSGHGVGYNTMKALQILPKNLLA